MVFIITQIDQKGDVVMTWKIPWLELLRRFLGRNAGFLGTQTAANSDLMEEGLVKGNSEGTVCAAHYAAVYWLEAASALCEAIGQSPIPSLSVYHDAAEA